MNAQEEFYTGAIVEFIDEPDRWGVVTAISDCGKCVYYKPKGVGLIRVGVNIDLLRVAPSKMV